MVEYTILRRMNVMPLIGLLLLGVLQGAGLPSSALAAPPSAGACVSLPSQSREECLDRVNGRTDTVIGTARTSPPGSRNSSESAGSLKVDQADPMLECAKLTDLTKKLRCFDRVKSGSRDLTEPKKPSRPQAHRPPAGDSVQANRAGTPSTTPRSNHKDSAEILSYYALEVVRQLGKEMLPEEYPVHAREHGIGGTVQALLSIGADGKIDDVRVARSSDNDELDQYVVAKISKLTLPKVPVQFRERAFSVLIPVKFAVRNN